MSDKLSEHPVIAILTIAAALTGLIWFLTGKDFPTLLRPVTGTAVSSTTVQAGATPSDTSAASTAASTADVPTETPVKPSNPSQGLPETVSSFRGSGSKMDTPTSPVEPANTTEPPLSDAASDVSRKANSDHHRRPPCSDADTGTYGFTNTKSEKVFTVILYYREGSDEGRTITVPPGQTQYVYDFPSGGHNYIVTYRAMVPIMSFPPGAPTMPQDVIYLRGEINVEQCKSGVMEIR